MEIKSGESALLNLSISSCKICKNFPFTSKMFSFDFAGEAINLLNLILFKCI